MNYTVIALSSACILVGICGLISRDRDIKNIPNMYKETLVLWNIFAKMAYVVMLISAGLIARELLK